MKKDVWLTISSQQQFAGCDEENIDLQTAATLYERGGKYYIAYEESELTGLEGTKTTVKLDGKTVALIRTGTFPSHMLFAEDHRRGRRTPHHRLHGRGGQLSHGRTSL